MPPELNSPGPCKLMLEGAHLQKDKWIYRREGQMGKGQSSGEGPHINTDSLFTQIQKQAELSRMLADQRENYLTFLFTVQERIQKTAYDLAQAGDNQPSKQLDYWLEAQTQILGPLHEKTRELAYLYWKAGGQQSGRTLDYWLAAENETLGPIWACIQDVAKMLWAQSGHQQDVTLDYWLSAEKRVWEAINSGSQVLMSFQPGPHGLGGDPNAKSK